MQKLTAWALLAFAISQCAVADEPRYMAEVHLYRIHGTPVHIYGHNGLDADVNSQLEGTLDLLITMAFEEVHLTEVFKFIGEIYGIPFQIDDGLVAPKGQNAAVFLSAGRVEYIDVKRVPVRQTLDMLLAPLGLDYVVTADYVRIVRASGKSPSDSARRQMMSRFDPGSQWFLVNSGSMRVGRSLVQFSKGARPNIGAIDGVENLANPEVIVMAGQQSKIEMGGEVPFLVPVPDSTGGYQLRATQVFAGLAIGLLFTPNDPDAVECNFDLTYRYVRERQATRGVDLPVGEPIIETINTNEKLKVTLDQPIAMLTRAGEDDDVILALLKVTQLPEPQPESQNKADAELPQYTVDMKLFQVRGDSDWEWWMRPYEKMYQIYEGAGRVIGPVSVSAFDTESKKIDWGKLGMRQVKQENILGSLRATGIIDHKRLIGEGILDLRGKLAGQTTVLTENGGRGGGRGANGSFISVFEHIDELYEGLTGVPRRFAREDLEGKLIIADISQTYKQEGSKVKPLTQGVAVFSEVISASTKDVFLLENLLLVRELRLGNQEKQQVESDFFRVKLRYQATMSDGSMNAYLLPVAQDEYLIVLTDFGLVKE